MKIFNICGCQFPPILFFDVSCHWVTSILLVYTTLQFRFSIHINGVFSCTRAFFSQSDDWFYVFSSRGKRLKCLQLSFRTEHTQRVHSIVDACKYYFSKWHICQFNLSFRITFNFYLQSIFFFVLLRSVRSFVCCHFHPPTETCITQWHNIISWLSNTSIFFFACFCTPSPSIIEFSLFFSRLFLSLSFLCVFLFFLSFTSLSLLCLSL